ncbi:MAG TPA: bifunctional riboflavin kinase/FAD synthetase [Rhizomicrobium sp.]|jgi:riboflavin kinase/FMN adenylyltransferase|nr:bifunctional riboflavin kinase/FAD synthetase [Rhizomicrobium sp.]
MRILRHFQDVPAELKGAVVAIGNFDGVHRGHQALIAEARREAEERRSPLAVLAFEPHPQEYFRPSPESFRLTPLRSKARLLAGLGVDVLFALPFDAEMARRAAPDFVHQVLLDGLGASGVVVGRDFEFGKGRAGNLATLSYMGEVEGFSVAPFDTVIADGDRKISSTNIRAALKASHPEEAARLLGHYWAIEARVEHGDARGRTFGFPTANMHLGHWLAPAFGVYAVRVDILDNDRVVGRHDGVANFGVRPMYRTPAPLLETHLFDFDGDLYGKYLSVELIAWLRPEAKFEGRDALIAQIRQDAGKARKILAAAPQRLALDA